MKKLVIGGLTFALVAMLCSTALAEGNTAQKSLYKWTSGGKVWNDLSWWGNSGAKPAPVKDATRSGYWWWPKQPATNANDSELWGNRGVVYSMYTKKPKPVAHVAPPPPPPVAPPKVTHKFVVLNNVLFDFDKSVLKPEGKAEVDKLVNYMKKYPKDTVEVIGHTCNLGSAAYNMKLGQRRADAVKKYMIEQGIDAKRITAISKGETDPAVPNNTPAHRKLNRRVEFKGTVVD